MKYLEIPIEVNGSVEDARLETYILDTPTEKIMIKRRPMVVICPGGGYEKLSFREGEPVAMQFLARGYHACVLRYSVAPARYPVPLLELGQVMRILRSHAAEWLIDTDKIFVSGASAGAHLAGMLGVFWNQGWLADMLEGAAREKGLHAQIRVNCPQAVLQVSFVPEQPRQALTAQQANEGEDLPPPEGPGEEKSEKF